MKIQFKDMEDYPVHMIICIVCVFALIGIGAFAVWYPPRGEITENILKYCWILVFTIAIFQIRPILNEAKSIRLTRGNTTIEAVGKDDEQPQPDADKK